MIYKDVLFRNISNKNTAISQHTFAGSWSVQHAFSWKVNGELRSGYFADIMGLINTKINHKQRCDDTAG